MMRQARRKSVIDPAALITAVENSLLCMGSMGFCVKCGHEQDGCEPDARKYECEDCGERAVFGAEELLIMGYAD
jgi:hypothetical protein